MKYIGILFGFLLIIISLFWDNGETIQTKKEVISISDNFYKTPETLPKIVVSKKDRMAMEAACYFESRGENKTGKVYVLQTIKNRVEHDKFPNTFYDVIYQVNSKGVVQFSWAKVTPNPENKIEKKALETCKQLVDVFLKVDVHIHDALYFHSTKIKGEWFKDNLMRIAQIGQHIFYKEKNG